MCCLVASVFSRCIVPKLCSADSQKQPVICCTFSRGGSQGAEVSPGQLLNDELEDSQSETERLPGR